jgi:ribonuclease P protein component
MLKKINRLTRSTFTKYFKQGKRHNTPIFSIIFEENPLFLGAVVVSKKLYKNAPARNRLRRQTYALLLDLFREKRKGVYIIIYNQKAKDLSRTELLKLLKNKLEEI